MQPGVTLRDLVHAIPLYAIKAGLLTVAKAGKINAFSGRILEIEGLPEPKPDTIFVVSGMVRDALEGRPDVLAPDTGKTAVRNQQGQVTYVTRLRGK